MKKIILLFLTLCLGLFLADGVVSLLDDSIALITGARPLSAIRGVISFGSLATALLVYCLMGATPLIPKRFFLPLTLFHPAIILGMLPVAIYHWEWLPQVAWLVSLIQVLFGLAMLAWLQGSFKFRRPLLPEHLLGFRKFSWLNLIGFVAINLLLILPAVFLYLGWCGSRAVDHFSAGFLALRSDSLAVRARQYTRSDGKTVHLIPMMHIGESNFYHRILQSIPSNSVILLEGVSDEKNLLERKLSYKKVASSLGLSEQQEIFEPSPEHRLRHADVDVEKFSKQSIEFLKLVTRIHTEGMTHEALREVMLKSNNPELMQELWDDLLKRRNEYLMGEIKDELTESSVIVVPWGAAHMPGLEEEVRRLGFQKNREEEFTILHYKTLWNRPKGK